MRVIVRTVGWTQKGGRRRRKKVNKVHEEVKSSKSSRRQKMAAQLAVRKNTPDTAVQGGERAVRVSACVVWMLNNNNNNNGRKKKTSSKMEFVCFSFAKSFPSRKIEWSEE